MKSSVWPYEEVQISPRQDGSYLLKTPWFARVLEISDKFKKQYQDFFSCPTDYSFNQQRELWTGLLGARLADPLVYILPRQQVGQYGPDHHMPAPNLNENLAMVQRFLKLTVGLSSQVITNLSLRDWDQDVILKMSQISNTDLYDPVALFSVLRRFYYLDCLDLDQTAKMYDFTRSLSSSPGQFRLVMGIIARQNFEVTRRCQEVLMPALKLAASAEKDLADFMKSEKGHDQLLRRGLEELKLLLADDCALPVTTLLLDAFKLNAESNFLAFAFTVSLFEESSPDGGTDPLTRALTDGGEQKAAQSFLIHSQINDGGHHDHIGLQLIAKMAPVSRDYALQAISLSEQLSKIFNTYTTQIFEKIQQRVQDETHF